MFTELHMKYVFFLYGLSFFILGFAILIYPKKNSVFTLAPHLNLVGGFGLTHGINEWIDLFLLIHAPTPCLPLELLRAVTLPVSFFFLLLFGVKKIEGSKRHVALQSLRWILPAAWLIMVIVYHDTLGMVDIGSRYLIGLPGAVLTSYALYRHMGPLKQTGLNVVIKHLRAMIIVFVLYGILAGAIVKKATFFPASVLNYDWVMATFGVPVQIFRAVCAAVLAYCTLRVLTVFHWETQQKFRENESRLRTIASASPAILFKSDVQGRLTSIQGQGIEALSVPAQAWIGQPLSNLFGDFDVNHLNAQSWKKGAVYRGNVTSEDKTYDIGYCPILGDAGEISGYVGAAMDISDRLKAQEEVSAYRRELSQTRRLTELGMMSKVLAKKLRKPLSVTQVLLQRLAVDLDKSNPERGISNILDQSLAEVHEAFSTVKRFCDHVDIPATSKSTVLDLQDLFTRMTAVFKERAERVNLDITLHLPFSGICLTMASKELQYIVSTLMEHILDRASQDAPQTLNIQCQRESGHILIVFNDTCRLLSEEEVKNAFIPFALTTSDAGPNGLGLAVIQKITEENQGSISVHSQEGQGTTFSLTLPFCPDQEVTP